MEKPPKTQQRVRGAARAVQATAHALRQELTPAEQKLWDALKGHQLQGLKFRRQHPVGTFILDFYCPAHRLVVEVDGGIHQGQAAHDAERTARLQEYGYRVLRFRNEEVLHRLPYVLACIVEAVKHDR